MTFCFSFEVLLQLNLIQVNMRGGGPSWRRDENLYCNFPISVQIVLSYYKSVKKTHRKKQVNTAHLQPVVIYLFLSTRSLTLTYKLNKTC